MNLTVKWCLLGLVTAVTSFGMAQAQDEGPAGTVQLGQQGQPAPGAASVQSPAQGQTTVPMDGPLPPVYPQFPMTPTPGLGSSNPSYGNYFRLTPFDNVMTPRVNIDSRGGGLYGYNAGYSNIGVMLPYKLDDNAVLFAQGMGLVTYDGRGGATVGTGWRYWDEGFDRIFGLSGWYDFDNGHAQPYQQLGLSLESLGRFVDYRVNGYLPVSAADHVLSTNLTNTSILLGSGIGILRNNTVEQSYSGFDAELGGPTPILGRYGLNAYIGGYHFMGNGTHGGNFTGVSGRLLSQINEDVSFGVQVTNDSAFGLNTQFQVFVNMPNGKSNRWLRNLRVKDRLVQNVFRQNRVIAKTDTFTSFDTAINPNTHQAFLVANIDPNRTANGDGSANNPFNSVAAYEALSQSQRQHYDIILVRPRTDATTTNLDTASTLDIYNGQRLLSTTTTQTILAANNGGITLSVPGFTGGADPMLFNSSGGNVITLVGGNTIGQQVSGFEIIGSATGNGIFGNNNVATNISDNNIHGGLNGVLLTNLSGTIAKGTEAQFFNNNVHDNVGNGIQILNNGSPPFVPNLDVVVQSNIFNTNGGSGLRMDAQAGATIGGVIGGPITAATSTTPAVNLSNTFENNGGSGLDLRANGGVLNFSQAAQAATTTTAAVPTFGIFNNTFISNVLDGLHIETTNNSLSAFTITNNAFGTTSGAATGNDRFGIGVMTDSGVMTLNIGGDLIKNVDGTTTNPGNTFNFNAVSAINLAATGTAILNYDINNNTITNSLSATVAPAHDAFSFTFDGTSGTDPFILTNLSDPGVTITSVSWNLAGTPATIWSTGPTGTGTATSDPILQPISSSLLTSLNGQGVIPGSNPLRLLASGTNANLFNLGQTGGLQQLQLGFTNFAATSKFQATSTFEQSGGSTPLTSAATAGSTLTVTFSNGLTSTQKVASVTTPDGLGVAAAGEAFGTSTPGFGTGVDGIHVTASGASSLNTAIIHNNTIAGYGNYGVQIETAGTATASHVVVENNIIQSNGTGVNGAGQNVFSGGGVQFARHDSSTLDVQLDNNTITSNFNTGLALLADGTATGGLVVNSTDNAITNNAGNGLQISSSGAGILTFNSNGDVFSGNGGGSGKNVAATGGDNIALFVAGTSVSNVNLVNVLSNSSNGNGLSATTSDSSTLNLVVDTVANSTFTGNSSFSNNKQNGILLTSNGDSYMHANVFNTLLNNNVQSGIAFNRNGASLVRSSIVNSNLSNNGTNGLSFHGLGSDPQDPNQPQSGTPNIINLVGDSLNFNGDFATNAGQGARIDLFGDSELVMNASNTTFSNNAENGVRIELTPGAEFGYQVGNQRAVWDNVQINNNHLNGVLITSDVAVAAPGNGFLPFNAPSVTFLQISANTGNTTISNNGANGILMQYPGGTHDVLVTGDLNPSTNFGTFIQGNTLNGISSVAGVESNPAIAPGSGVVLTVDKVLIGGPNAADANGQDGIDFEVQSQFVVPNAATGAFTWSFNAAGFGTLNVNNSVIQNNGGDGIALIGNNLDAASAPDQRFQNGSGDPAGRLAANISNSMIIGNKGNGVTISLTGQLGWTGSDFNPRSDATNNNFVFTNNVISSNGLYGVFYQQNTAVNVRSPGSENANFETFRFFDPQPTTPPGPFDPTNFGNQFPFFPFNTGDNTDLIDGFLQSNWMWLGTSLNSNLVMTGNTIQFNGTQAVIPGNGNPILPGGDGIFIRVSTNSYLSADIRNNTMSGNVQNDFHVESFLAYNPVTNVAPQPTGSVARAAPDSDTVVLDDTAQMDLRFTGNTGNTIDIVNPLVNFGVQNGGSGPLDPRTSPNGAVYGRDPLKDTFSFQFPEPRVVQLFQVDDGGNLNSTNNFTQNGVVTDLVNGPNGFFQGDWHLRQFADPAFPNGAFPQNFTVSPGNPFLP